MHHLCRLFGGLGLVLALSPIILARAESAVKSTCLELEEQGITCLDQGWDSKTRQKFYHTSQGSRFIRYDWIKALKLEGTNTPLLSRSSMEKFGYLPDLQDSRGLPVGFTVDKGGETEEWLGMTCAACHTAELHYQDKKQDKKLRIDGAPAIANLMEFYRAMYRAFRAMCQDTKKREEFVKEVLGDNFRSKDKKEDLLIAVADRMRRLKGQVGIHEWKWNEQGNAGTPNEDEDGLLCGVEVKENFRETKKGKVIGDWNYVPPLPDSDAHPYGPGRVDAIGLLINELICHKTETWGNCSAPNAPVNYPSLWYTPRFKNLQWNGALDNSEGRNIGEALGVFVRFELPQGNWRDLVDHDTLFSSTLDLDGIKSMWADVEKLKPPPWPSDLWEETNPKKNTAEKSGEQIYDEYCVKCHPIMRSNRMAQSEDHDCDTVRDGDGKVKFCSPYVGTDKKMAENFLCRRAELPQPLHFLDALGSLVSLGADEEKEKKQEFCDGYKHGPMRAHDLVTLLGGVITLKAKDKAGSAKEFLKNEAPRLSERLRKESLQKDQSQEKAVYKAGPLDGIWATAPYLHNGSVPNLYQLLLPAKCPENGVAGKDCRMKTFCVGNREFDPEKVGFDTTCKEGTFKFDTAIEGNLNRGHDGPKYGTNLNERERENLIEYLKSL